MTRVLYTFSLLRSLPLLPRGVAARHPGAPKQRARRGRTESAGLGSDSEDLEPRRSETAILPGDGGRSSTTGFRG